VELCVCALCADGYLVLQDGRTALILSAVNGHVGASKELLAAGADFNATDNVRVGGVKGCWGWVWAGMFVFWQVLSRT
jgi:hypothetical protein